MAKVTEHDVMTEVEAMLAEKTSPLTPDCCIYKVRYQIRRLNKDAYTPKVVSIGLIHYGNSNLQNMESYKQIYFQRFIERTKKTVDCLVHKLVNKVKELEPRVRRSCSEKIKLSERKLVRVILVDAIFILELLLMYNNTYPGELDELMLSKPWPMTNIAWDLILLENQLPFFVLEELFNLAFPSDQRASLPSLLKLAFEFFNCYNVSNLDLDPNTLIIHFTDMLRTFNLLPPSRRPKRGISVTRLRNATTLLEAGVEFKVNEKGTCLLDLKLSGRALEIPKFVVDDAIETVYSNIVALEQCYYPSESYLTDYILVLHGLINTGKDVDVLVKGGIIDNWVGDSNAVANLFNGLGKNVTLNSFNSSYHKICQDLNAIHDCPLYKLMAALRRDYGNTPWRAAASFAAIILLVLTLIQTVCSILQVLTKKG